MPYCSDRNENKASVDASKSTAGGGVNHWGNHDDDVIVLLKSSHKSKNSHWSEGPATWSTEKTISTGMDPSQGFRARVCFTNDLWAFKYILLKFVYCRNHATYENFKLKL